MCGCRKKRKAEGGASAVASKKSKQETEEDKGLRVRYVHECLLYCAFVVWTEKDGKSTAWPLFVIGNNNAT